MGGQTGTSTTEKQNQGKNGTKHFGIRGRMGMHRSPVQEKTQRILVTRREEVGNFQIKKRCLKGVYEGIAEKKREND